MNQRTVFLFVAVAALGAVGVTTAIMSAAAPAQAGSCQKQYGKDSCHGCDFRGPGIFSSDGECHHRAP